MNVGRMRDKHGIKAPAMTGHDEFERAVRVHMNTMEGAIAFLPALWIAEIWFGGWIPPVAGFVWVVGRVIYMLGYMAAPEKRETGFIIQAHRAGGADRPGRSGASCTTFLILT